MRPAAFCVTLGTALLAAVSGTACADDMARGRDLYQQHCDGCHAESVHGRAKRAARDFNEVRAFVVQRSAMIGLQWGVEEVDDVTLYLNDAYYHYAVPAQSAERRKPALARNTTAR